MKCWPQNIVLSRYKRCNFLENPRLMENCFLIRTPHLNCDVLTMEIHQSVDGSTFSSLTSIFTAKN